MIERHQDIGFRIVGRNRTLSDVEGDSREVPQHALAGIRPFVGHDTEIDNVAMFQASADEITLIYEHDVASSRYPSIAIVHAVDRRIVLIMTSDRRKRENITICDTRI